MSEVPTDSPQPSSDRREAEREALLEEAMENPGVADALKAYGELEQFRIAPVTTPTKPQFASGANG